ncbi:hypothetical protein [Bacillus glycinifermentans]|uniref:Uncharacterized protein n=1 Tax=Bacillus glycinifermentans TaxID=1664069 RepID=A0ABU6HD96_9BACI|nr:hypothetical protein [Bacillus glycinifermentans]MEC0488122.1 hypothetical protein [Bacillus glycinifermentans]
MTKDELEAIRQRVEAATESYWAADDSEWPGNENLRYWVKTHWDGVAAAVTKEDADFIANARQDIPELLDYVAEVEQELREATLIIDRVENLLSKMRYGTEYEVYGEVYRFLYGKDDEDDNV